MSTIANVLIFLVAIGFTVSMRILLVQAVPVAVALTLVWAANRVG